MTTKNSNQPMMDAFKRAWADIASLHDWLECELNKQDDQEISWGTVATLEDARDRLVETLALFSGFDEAEIRRSLDELHS